MLETQKLLSKRQLKSLHATLKEIESLWEFCSSNVAPYWDLSLALHDLSIDAKQASLGGYGVSET